MAELTTGELMLIEQRVTNASKSAGVAYLLWLFTWPVSGHRFYLGRPGTAVLQIMSYFVVIGFVWLLIDGFLISGMIRDAQNRERTRLMDYLRAEKDDKVAAAA